MVATEDRWVALPVWHPLTARAAVAVADLAAEPFVALGVALLSAGNAEIYRRDDVVIRPVIGLQPSELAVVWHATDDRKAVRVFVDACVRCLCGS